MSRRRRHRLCFSLMVKVWAFRWNRAEVSPCSSFDRRLHTSLHNQDTQRSHNTQRENRSSYVTSWFSSLFYVWADYFICASFHILTRFGWLQLSNPVSLPRSIEKLMYAFLKRQNGALTWNISSRRELRNTWSPSGCTELIFHWSYYVCLLLLVVALEPQNNDMNIVRLPQTWARTSFYWLWASIDKTPASIRSTWKFTTF